MLNPSSDFVRSLARGLAVIEAFNKEHPEMTLTEVARRTNVDRATARRLAAYVGAARVCTF